MRMWLVPPEIMCQQHLLGEHVEMHMFAGSIRKGISMAGYLENGLLDPKLIQRRHDELASEMKARGLKHQTPMQASPWIPGSGKVSPWASLQELTRRCPECAKRFEAKLSRVA